MANIDAKIWRGATKGIALRTNTFNSPPPAGESDIVKDADGVLKELRSDGNRRPLYTPMLTWAQERAARAEALLNTNGLRQVDDEYLWKVGTHPIQITAPAVRDAALPGFINQPGGGTGIVAFGNASQEPVLFAPKTTPWYLAVHVFIRNSFNNGNFCNAIQMIDSVGTNTIELGSLNAGNPGPFFLQPFIANVAQPTVSCGTVGTPGSPTCPIGSAFTIAMYNDPQTGFMGVEFSDVSAFRQQVPLIPNPPVMSIHEYSSDTQALLSIGACYLARSRP